MLVTVTLEFDIRKCSPGVCKQFNKPSGTLEVIDSDGSRDAFVDTFDAAMVRIDDVMLEAGFSQYSIATG